MDIIIIIDLIVVNCRIVTDDRCSAPCPLAISDLQRLDRLTFVSSWM